jgi:hypothetical protein
MLEAVRCYSSRAYRGSIVLAFAALCEHLLRQLEQHAQVNQTASQLYTDVMKKKSDQEVFEGYLVDQMTSNKLIEARDADRIRIIRDLRHKSAHPSGHMPRASEARHVLDSVADFLIRPILSTSTLVDTIVTRLPNQSFFHSDEPAHVRQVVGEEVRTLDQRAIPMLIAKLIKDLQAVNSTSRANAVRFLMGLAMADSRPTNNVLVRSLLDRKADDDSLGPPIIRVLSANGNLWPLCAKHTKERVKRTLDRLLASRVTECDNLGTSFFRSLLQGRHGQAALRDVEPQLRSWAEANACDPDVADLAIRAKGIRNAYVGLLIQKAGSRNHREAIKFAKAAPELEKRIKTRLKDEEGFKILVAVKEAADNRAYASEALCNGRFRTVLGIRRKATRYVRRFPRSAAKTLRETFGSGASLGEFVSRYLSG